MPVLNRKPPTAELQRLIAAFLKAETDIINEIARLRAGGLVDYHAEAALDRVQTILRRLEDESWTYVPRMIERQFYIKHPGARKRLDIPETAEKHISGYGNAAVLTGEQMDIVQRLTMNLMGEIDAAAATVTATLQNALIGRIEPDVFRRAGLEQVLALETTGRGAYKELPKFVEALRREGVTAFIDKAGRHWSLHTYGSMVLRTTSRQAEVLSVLTRDPEQDLYKISSHNTTCRRCAPLEGRVYSRSGTDPDFPPLAAAFGKVDPTGPDTLSNTYLNIHPNCLVPGGLVLAEGVMAHSCREYDGPVISLKTSTGNKITITPNHPILTTKGFVAAGSLQKGDKIVEATREYPFLFGEAPNDINIPTPIEKVAHSLVEAGGGSSVRVKSSPIQFHGDGSTDGEVNIVFSKRFGISVRNILDGKPIRENHFPSAHLGRVPFFTKRTFFQVFRRPLLSANSVMSRFGFGGGIEAVSVQGKKSTHVRKGTPTTFGDLSKSHTLVMQGQKSLKLFSTFFNIVGRNFKKFFPGCSSEQAIVHQGPLDSVFRHTEMLSNLLVTEPLAAKRLQSLFCNNGLVVSELLHVETSKYHGNVYNLQTKYGFYAYNNIVTHNCLHALIPWTPAGRSEEELRKIKQFSSFKTNPPTRDPRTEKQIEAYRLKERGRAQWLADYRQWERYRLTIPDDTPRTFGTFQRHKQADDDKYKHWEKLYREANHS